MQRLIRRAWHDPVWSKIIAWIIGGALLAIGGLVWGYSAGLMPPLLDYVHTRTAIPRWQLWIGALVLLLVGVLVGSVVRKPRTVRSGEPIALVSTVSESRPVQAARPFFFGGLCWRVQPDFFNIYHIDDRPTAASVRSLIFGPLCPECGRVRHKRVEPSSRYEEPFDVIAARCFSSDCKHEIREVPFSGGLGYDDAKLDVYKAAQALALNGKPFPAGPCAKFEGNEPAPVTRAAQVVSAPATPDNPMTPEHRAVLEAIAGSHDGMHSEDFADMPPQRAQYVMEQLEELGLLDAAHNYVSGTRWYLSKAGRKFMVQMGWL